MPPKNEMKLILRRRTNEYTEQEIRAEVENCIRLRGWEIVEEERIGPGPVEVRK